ncbi:MAG: thioredoxin domain-containing protein [Candidatus Paceibacterota bacterium]
MKNAWTVVGLVAVVLVGGSIIYSNSVSKNYDEGVDVTKEYIKGNPDANITLVEFSDFECPACASWFPVVSDIMDKYGDQVRFEYKHFPLPIHPSAEIAARAAEAAGQQDKFYEFHDLLFENQNSWKNSLNPTGDFEEYAEELSLNVELFEQHMKSSLIKDKVRSELNEGRSLGINATPTFVINGEVVSGISFDQLASTIEDLVNPEVEFSLPNGTETGG